MAKWLILACALAASGCASSTPIDISCPKKPAIFSKYCPALKCEIEGANDFEKEFIRETLSIMPRCVQEAIDKLVVHKEKTADFKDTIAYCEHKAGKNELHILRDNLNRSTLWHEAAHAYDFSLGLEDDEDWLGVTGDGLGHSDGRIYPSRGVLRRYGARNWLEDRAVWVESVYCLVSGGMDVFSKITDKADKRYRQKLDLLLEQGFIDKSAYEMALEKLSGGQVANGK